jgi:hypothetical protein
MPAFERLPQPWLSGGADLQHDPPIMQGSGAFARFVGYGPKRYSSPSGVISATVGK